MKKIFLSATYILYAIVVVYIDRNIDTLLAELLLVVSFVPIVRYRHELANFFSGFSRLPFLLLFIITSYPFMLFVENVNCLPPELGGCKLVPLTLPPLTIFLLAIYALVRLTKTQKFWVVLTPFCALGIAFEATFGGEAAAFRALDPFWFGYVSFYMWVSYAYFTVVPLTMLQKRISKDCGAKKDMLPLE